MESTHLQAAKRSHPLAVNAWEMKVLKPLKRISQAFKILNLNHNLPFNKSKAKRKTKGSSITFAQFSEIYFFKCSEKEDAQFTINGQY